MHTRVTVSPFTALRVAPAVLWTDGTLAAFGYLDLKALVSPACPIPYFIACCRLLSLLLGKERRSLSGLAFRM